MIRGTRGREIEIRGEMLITIERRERVSDDKTREKRSYRDTNIRNNYKYVKSDSDKDKA